MFSKTCQYAIRAALYLAIHASADAKLGVKEIAEALQAPPHFLGKILQQLARHQLIASEKGPRGGFYLSPANRQATLSQVVECIDGPNVFSGCILGLPVCSATKPCPLHVQAFAYREGLSYQLRNQSIEDLALRMQRDHQQI